MSGCAWGVVMGLMIWAVLGFIAYHILASIF